MITTQRILSPPRLEIIKISFMRWYDALDEPTRTIRGLGYTTKDVSDWKKGERPIPTPMLIALYQITGDSGFLLTKEEKTHHARRNPRYAIPADANWPDLEGKVSSPRTPRSTQVRHGHSLETETTRETPINAIDLRVELKRVVGLVEKFAKLPSKDPEREKARRFCVSAAMRLFAALKRLDYEFPEDFEDILGQLDQVTRTFKAR